MVGRAAPRDAARSSPGSRPPGNERIIDSRTLRLIDRGPGKGSTGLTPWCPCGAWPLTQVRAAVSIVLWLDGPHGHGSCSAEAATRRHPGCRTRRGRSGRADCKVDRLHEDDRRAYLLGRKASRICREWSSIPQKGAGVAGVARDGLQLPAYPAWRESRGYAPRRRRWRIEQALPACTRVSAYC
jgi:hypothetical protein